MDRQAADFDAFFRQRVPALLRAAYLLTGDRHLAEDLVQEALARTLRVWRRLAADGNPEAYVRRTMYHLQVSRWRRGRVAEVRAGDMPESASGGDYAVEAVERLALRSALLTLSRRQRAVFVMRYAEDRSEAETAEILDCEIGTVKSHASRALRRLRSLVPDLTDLDRTEGAAR
jgi:RNA polymerase sigma-70 factor (sigma-E family)